MTRCICLCLSLFALMLTTSAQAHDVRSRTYVVVETPSAPAEPEAPPPPSVFAHGTRGLLVGSLVGVSAAYLAVRPGGVNGSDGRSLAFGAGVGAVAGAGLGISLGLLDLSRSPYGRSHVVLRDTLYGTAFGALTGGITGGLFVLRSGDGEHALFGATLGAVTGAGLGLVIGLIDSFGAFERERCGRGAPCAGRRYAPALGATTDVSGALVFAPAVAGRF